jgi:hypothetical protein
MHTKWQRLALPALVIGLGALSLVPQIASTDSTPEEIRSSPKDTTEYVRDLVPGESGPLSARAAVSRLAPSPMPVFPSIRIVDTVVSNTDANLTNTDMANDGELSIAVNPEDTDEITISSFSTGWNGPNTNAVIYHSTDGGTTWTQQGVPPPPGWIDTGCPCDWTWDWGRAGALSGTILAVLTNPFDVTSVTTTDVTTPGAFAYNGNPAQLTNNNVPGSIENADQPWLLTNLDPAAPTQDRVYVAWDDFANSDGISGVDMRVAVSTGVSPLNFTLDQQAGNSSGAVNPGLRLADDRVNGTMWVLWGRNVAAGAGGSKNMDYMLNRSTDGGSTWTLNGNPNLPTTGGIIVANADSTQPQPKFGTVNALLGGVHHAGVDPISGDLYYVYGNRDSGTGNNRLAVRRISDAGGGSVSVGAESLLTGQVQAALPQVAVLDNGTLGVFYYTYDGMNSGFPQFTAHLVTSLDQLGTLTDTSLLTFLSSATDDGDPRQRVLGDYMQMKAVDNCFYGSFTANGAPFGRPVANHDPIFFETCVENPPIAQCMDVTTDTDPGLCSAAVSVDDGSLDPGGEDITLSQAPPSPYPPGDTEVTLTVTDEEDLSDSCTAQVTVVDTEPPTVACNTPAAITPPDAPISFTSSTQDNCGASVTITRFDCFTFTKNGKRIDKTHSCVVDIDGDTITIVDSGGVDDHITWEAVATDAAGNTTPTLCEVAVENPGKTVGPGA